MNATKKVEKAQTFAERLQELMDNHEPKPVGLLELSQKIRVSYEHCRKILRGKSVPSHFIIAAIAKFFKEDADELEQIAKADTFQRKYADQFPAPEFNKELAVVQKAWPLLEEEQQAEVLALIKNFVSENTSKKKALVH